MPKLIHWKETVVNICCCPSYLISKLICLFFFLREYDTELKCHIGNVEPLSNIFQNLFMYICVGKVCQTLCELLCRFVCLYTLYCDIFSFMYEWPCFLFRHIENITILFGHTHSPISTQILLSSLLCKLNVTLCERNLLMKVRKRYAIILPLLGVRIQNWIEHFSCWRWTW